MADREVNRYVLHEKIGSGGMSTVRRARLRSGTTGPEGVGPERDLAIKVIAIDDLDPDFERRLRREPEIHEKLRHENIVELLDWFREGDEFFLVMEYVDGVSLSKMIRDDGPIPFDRARDLMRGVLRAVALLHRNDVIHRDIKPGNILVRPDGTGVLTDFGIAKFGWQQGETRTQLGLGTPEYMSPEQVRGSGIDYRTDIWSLGITLFEMLTGRKPFARDAETPAGYADVIARIMAGSVGDPRRLLAGVPDGAAGVIRTATALDPNDRYATAAAFLGALEVVDPRISTPYVEEEVVDEDATIVLGQAAGAARPDEAPAPAEGGGQSVERSVGTREPQPRKKGKGGLVAVLLILFAAAAGWGTMQLIEQNRGAGEPEEGLDEADAAEIAEEIAGEYRRHFYDGDVEDLARLYADGGVSFFRISNADQRVIAQDYRRFFDSVAKTDRLDVVVLSARPISDSLIETRWRITYEREKFDGTILRGVAEHDYRIAWVDDRWAIVSERVHKISRDNRVPPPPDTSTLEDDLVIPEEDLPNPNIDVEGDIDELDPAIESEPIEDPESNE